MEADLAPLTHSLAQELQKPASQRDRACLTDLWAQITNCRPPMKSVGRALKKIEKPVRTRLKRKDYLARRKNYERARAYLRRLYDWDEVETIVQRHIDPEPSPLFGALQPTHQDALVTMLYMALHRLSKPVSQDQDAKEHGCFPDFPSPFRALNR